jgi:copper resistance protein C
MRYALNHSLIAALLLAASAGQGLAHAHVESTEPRDSDHLQTSPAQIAIRFGSKVEAAFSTIAVTTGRDEAVDIGPIELSDNAQALSAMPLTLLRPGLYHVRWKALSQDGHPVSGEFSFTVSK